MRRIAVGVLLVLGLLPGVAWAAFPGSDPSESVRLNPPDDPEFDCAESDGGGGCSSVYDEDYERFGCAPNSTQATALYKNPADTARQQAQNTLAGRNPLGQIPGVSADRAWKRSIGRPDVRIAILDTSTAAGAARSAGGSPSAARSRSPGGPAHAPSCASAAPASRSSSRVGLTCARSRSPSTDAAARAAASRASAARPSRATACTEGGTGLWSRLRAGSPRRGRDPPLSTKVVSMALCASR